jgi:SAM-dependent methyltransferase
MWASEFHYQESELTMCNPAIIEYAKTCFLRSEVEGRSVLEVGSANVSGSVRSVVEALRPSQYLGVDTSLGPGVDEVCDIADLASRFGRDCFEVVICTEVLEHVRPWRAAVSNIKNVLGPKGVLLMTTRSKGFRYHPFPYDFWRYEVEDIESLFADVSIESIAKDPSMAGVFLKAHKPVRFVEANLDSYELYSILRRKRCRDVGRLDVLFGQVILKPLFAFRTHVIPAPIKTLVKKVFPNITGLGQGTHEYH